MRVGSGLLTHFDYRHGLPQEMTEATTSEKDAQEDYEQLMKDAADRRLSGGKRQAYSISRIQGGLEGVTSPAGA